MKFAAYLKAGNLPNRAINVKPEMPRITRATVLMKPMFVSYRKGRTFENMYDCLLSNKHHQYTVESFVNGSWLSVERTTLSAVVYSSCPLRRTGSTLPPKFVFLLSKFEMTINRNGHFLEKSFDVSVRNTVRHFSNHHFAKETTTKDWIDAGSKLPSMVWVEILARVGRADGLRP